MLQTSKIMAFIPSRDHHQARPFYEGVLGLRFVADDGFAMEFDANDTMLRISTVPHYKAAPFTVLGWQVPDIAVAVRELERRGVKFQKYPGMKQDELGIWTSPTGAKVAWFKDPDENVLSLTEFA